MDIVIVPIINCVLVALSLYRYAILFYIVLGWLEFFKIVNPYSQLVYSIHNALFSLVEPALRHIRRFLPPRMLIDFSPIILILFVYLIEDILHRLVLKLI
jgi:YggT family protein